MNLRNIALVFSLALIAFAATFSPILTHQTSPVESGRYIDILLERAKACISSNPFLTQQSEMIDLLDALKEGKVYREVSSDDLRVKLVTIQGTIEHVMACAQALGEIVELVGVIHCPTPATPLCMYPHEELSEGLLDPSIANDIHKQLTVRSRAQIVREYLHKGGKLYITYPRGGLEKRTPEQQNTYLTTIEQFPNQLMDWVLDTNTLPSDYVGAIYLFRDRQGCPYAFSIKSTQANSPQEYVEWGLWFGTLNDPAIGQRINHICEYLHSIGGPDIRTEFRFGS